MVTIGIDIGGTNIKAGVVDVQGKILKKSSIKTSKTKDYRIIAADIAEQVRALLTALGLSLSDVGGAGVGCPGTLDVHKGTVDYANNLEWEDVPLAATLSAHLDGLPIRLINDANAAALGEVAFGAGKKYGTIIFITLGTGVGGGIILDGNLYEGNCSKGAELGHTVIQRHGEQCTCGRRGCLEAYASASALVRETKSAMRKDKKSLMWKAVGGELEAVSGITAFECAEKGDRSAQRVVHDYIEALGEGLCDFVNVFRPEAIILGGGVCAQGETLLGPLREFLRTYGYGGERAPSVELLIASLGNDAGLIGAATISMKERGILRTAD